MPSPQNPTQLEQAAFLMNAPFTYTAADPNNVWMNELTPAQRKVDFDLAMSQWFDLYSNLASEALVYVLPSPQAGPKLQDLVFVANLGIALEHTKDANTVVLSNFTSRPRLAETGVGQRFFGQMGYKVTQSPYKFEGEADLKHLYDDVYVGGYGQRSSKDTYDWMAKTFGMKILPLLMQDEHLYHLDCSVFPITAESTLVCCEAFEEDELDKLAELTEIIEVSEDDAYAGICNSVRVHNTILTSSDIHTYKQGTQEYAWERSKIQALENISSDLGLECTLVNLSEFTKAGAMLSCMVMHLNRFSVGAEN